MQTLFNSSENANIFDLVLNTYGSLDFIPKFLKDNNITDVNYISKVGDVFKYETDLVTNEFTSNTIAKNDYQFATSKIKNVEFEIIENYLLTENGIIINTENQNKILL